MPDDQPDLRVCPQCKSEIPAIARKCRYCGSTVRAGGVELVATGLSFGCLVAVLMVTVPIAIFILWVVFSSL